jgi:hypothetical protein
VLAGFRTGNLRRVSTPDRDLQRRLKTLLVRNVCFGGPVDETDLKSFFGQFGFITSIRADWDKEEVLVQYLSNEEAEVALRRAVDGKIALNGAILRLQWAKPSRKEIEMAKKAKEERRRQRQEREQHTEDSWRAKVSKEQREDWERKLVVDDTTFHVSLKGAQFKSQSLLLDPPKKLALKQAGVVDGQSIFEGLPYEELPRRDFAETRRLMQTPQSNLSIPLGKVEHNGAFYLHNKQKEGLGVSPLYKRTIRPLRRDEVQGDARFGP